MQKSIKSILKGIKKGYQIPTLPDHIIAFTNQPLIRIMRVLGGVSFITMMSKSYLNYPFFVLYFLIFFSLIFNIYHFYLAYHRIKHIRFLLKSGAYEVRNSPLDRLAFLAAKAIGCFKGACETAQPIGVSLGLMVTADEVLKASNVDPIFMPIIGGVLKTILPESASRTNARLLNLAIDQSANINVEMSANESLLDKLKNLNVKGVFNDDDFSEFKKIILENQDELKGKNSELKSKILELLDKNRDK